MDRFQIAGKTALVTGAARRIGRAVALALAGEGANVVLHYRGSGDEAAETAAQVAALGAKAWRVQGDLAEAGTAQAVFEEAVAHAGPLDILVNSASIFPTGTLAALDLEALHMNVDVNALAPAILARGFAGQQRPGVIINFLDTRAWDYDREHVAYHLSKRMLYTLTRIMAVEYAPAIRVNAVAPGLILPPEGEDASYLAALAHTNPLGCHGALEDIVEAVLFLLKSSFVTGQVIFVDGGRHLRGSMYG